ncbi:EAL domain-containing protein [Kineococcus glutinatus]|uniref:EAL domain-containing protein n=1 Tax=Kineococcus glutinatus TaxID=1070872 RepID=A0ABP9I035_9ACTN
MHQGESVAQLLELAREVLHTPLVQVRQRDGRVVDLVPAGAGASPHPLTPAQQEALRVVAALLTEALQEHDHRTGRRQRRVRALDDLVRGEGRSTVLQPIVDLRSGAVTGCEALSRFRSRRGRPLPAEVVFADARRCGLATALEHAALRGALELLPRVPAGAYLSVNVSPEVLLDPGTAPLLLARSPERLVVELTEHRRVPDYPALAVATDRLRAHGARIAVDDAGSGFASLQHVLHVGPDVVKLDVAFVRGVDLDPGRRAATRALVGLTREVGATLVAEGVETAGELAELRRLGVDCGQGNWLGAPAAPTGSSARDGSDPDDGSARDGSDPDDGSGPAPPRGYRAAGAPQRVLRT